MLIIYLFHLKIKVSLHNKKEETLKGIQKEIDFLKKLHHLNIVDYIDFIATDTSYNIILE